MSVGNRRRKKMHVLNPSMHTMDEVELWYKVSVARDSEEFVFSFNFIVSQM